MAAAKTKTARKKPAAKKSATGTRTSKKHNKLSKELILLIADRVGQGVPIKTESTVQIYLPDNGRNRKMEKK